MDLQLRFCLLSSRIIANFVVREVFVSETKKEYSLDLMIAMIFQLRFNSWR